MSSGMITIARPYALAAFQYAEGKKQLAEWKQFLDAAAEAAKNPNMKYLVTNPEVSSTQLLNVFSEILEPVLDAERKNFLRMLAENKRLTILSDIAALYNTYYAEAEKMVKVNVVTAISVSDAYKQKLKDALTKKLHKQVSMQCEVDPAVIGGAVIRIGDRVIDGSVRGKLNRLLAFSLR